MGFSYIPTTTAMGTSAAARQRRLMMQQEEEEMTSYTQEDLDGDWEFKIVRSISGAFSKPEVLQQLIDEEARAGWVMVEKFDEYRVRFKRPRSARVKDTYLPAGVDPYRTHYGAPVTRYLLVVFIAAGLAVLLGVGVMLFVIFSTQMMN